MVNWGKVISSFVDNDDDKNNNQAPSAPDQVQQPPQNYGQQSGYQQTYNQQQYAQAQAVPQGGQDDLRWKIENNIYRYRKQYGLNLGEPHLDLHMDYNHREITI